MFADFLGLGTAMTEEDKMGFKEEVEAKYGKKISSFSWWNAMAIIATSSLYADIADVISYYRATGDDTKITPKQKEFLLGYYESLFRSLK